MGSSETIFPDPKPAILSRSRPHQGGTVSVPFPSGAIASRKVSPSRLIASTSSRPMQGSVERNPATTGNT
jgi:hypothetical protein